MVLTPLIVPLLDGIDPTSLLHHLLLQTLTHECHLLNNTLPDHFGGCWLCVPPGSNLEPFVALPKVFLTTLVSLDSVTSTLRHCSQPTSATIPYLAHISFSGITDITDCSNSSGTCLQGTLGSTDCSNTLTLRTQLLCPNVHKDLTLWLSVYHHLPTGWSGTCTLLCALLFLFPKLGEVPGDSRPRVYSSVAWTNKRFRSYPLS